MTFQEVLAHQDGALRLAGVPVRELAERFDTPLYAYARSALLERARRFGDALGAAHLVAYAIKANMNLAVAKTLVDAGCGVDVTSGGELARALQVGADPGRIVYSGVGKRDFEIDRALGAGIRMFNVESLDELVVLDARARALGRRAAIAFRLNPDVDPQTHPHISTGLRGSKFGIPIEEAPKAYAHARTLANIDARGVACHIGSQLTSIEPLRDSFQRIKDSVLLLRAQGHTIDSIDIGGGLGVDYTGSDRPPTPELYVSTVLEVVGGLGATVVCEPGRALVAGAGVLITRVLYQKHNGDKRFVIVDAAMNDYLRPALYGAQPRLEFEPARAGDPQLADLVGPVCESTDRFVRERALPPLENGDLVVLRDTGAYGFAMASTYNGRPLAAEVMVQGSRVELVRRRQTLEETWSGERTPEW